MEIECLLENLKEKNFEEKLSILTKITEISKNTDLNILAEYEIDNILLQIFKDSNTTQRIDLYKILNSLFLLVNDPTIFLEIIKKDFVSNNDSSLYAAMSLYFLMSTYNINYSEFYKLFYQIISPTTIKKDIETVLCFVKTILSTSIPTLKCVQAYIKKLCSLCLLLPTSDTISILHTVYVIMRIHPITLKMCLSESIDNKLLYCLDISFDTFQPYLFEFDILYFSIPPVKKIISIIRNECRKKTKKYEIEFLLNEKCPYSINI
ncbi:hypothetical protein CWI36_0249p0010 [Hamiltosporidium magnivora]|uniref:CCAAT-binding factor domain-containing protein n=1 Tax=Hamiltosporidium magnivora TaxID=148818 RepID=A0A4V2JWF0_9MICR|nr:hypothetical protein CWI36_0249p0010 [Hamiltosporidium magnivora]